MTVKLTIVVDNPNDPDAFEAVYNSPANREGLGKIPNNQRVESAAALASPGIRELFGGLAQAATGGIRFLLSDIED